MSSRFIHALALVSASLFLSGNIVAQDKPKKDEPKKEEPKKEDQKKEPAKPPKKPGDLKDYKEVITTEAKTQEGVFKVHRLDDKVYWEIPANLLERDFLWQTELSDFSASMGDAYPGMAIDSRVLRFSRKGNKLYVKFPSFDNRAVPGSGLENSVKTGNVDPLGLVLEIQTESDAKAPVVDVTGIFLGQGGDLSVGPRLRANADPSRSYIDRISTFPQNIETRTVMTLIGMPSGFSFGSFMPTSSTATIHASLVLLPEQPMQGRYQDSRVGYFSTYFLQYGSDRHRVQNKAFIDRFRLEKKDNSLALSEPKKPIVFYVSREVPEKWRGWIKKGIEAWQPAFEQAGFLNAIIAKDAPSKEEDPNWDPEDVRYSVIRWAPSTTQNAMGPHVADPRSGETLSAHVIMWHNILALVEDWYYVQSSANDSRAKKRPLPDDLMGELVQYVVVHEVGHTLGLMHNFRASSSYSIADLRNQNYVRENGVAASIMDYARFNYVSQPGDGVPQIGKVGPYDRFAIEWGYKPIVQASKAEDEKEALDQIAARQVADKRLRWAGDFAGFRGLDPGTQMEDLGDDSIEASRLGLLNINRIGKDLVSGATRFGEDYDDLETAYSNLEFQIFEELFHVVRNVGGVESNDFHAGRGGPNFKPIDATRQRKAVWFLMHNLAPQPALMEREVLSKISQTGSLSTSTFLQQMVLSSLLSESRCERLVEQEQLLGKDAYSVRMLVGDVTNGVWPNVNEAKPTSSIWQRQIQRSFLELMDFRINGSKTDLKLYGINELRALASKLDKAIARSTDPVTKAHFVDSRKEIEKIVSGKSKVSLQSLMSFGLDAFITKAQEGNRSCWESPSKKLYFEAKKDPQGFLTKYAK